MLMHVLLVNSILKKYFIENLIQMKYIPVTKIKTQLINRITDAQIPPKTLVCQKSVRILQISAAKITLKLIKD